MLWLSAKPLSAAGQITPLPLLTVLIPAILAVASTFHKGLNKETQSHIEAEHFACAVSLDQRQSLLFITASFLCESGANHYRRHVSPFFTSGVGVGAGNITDRWADKLHCAQVWRATMLSNVNMMVWWLQLTNSGLNFAGFAGGVPLVTNNN